jgi:FkbM family methyltransferase
MHNGDDTAYYLSRGFSVVAIEANPILAKHARARFADVLERGDLVLLEMGISDREGVFTFWINEENDAWSSFIRTIGCRGGTKCEPVDVECITLERVLDAYGVPYYAKIDIEGGDIHALRSLTPTTAPPYLSVEAHRLEYLALLSCLGYSAFKCIDQSNHNDPRPTDNESVASLVIGPRVRQAFRAARKRVQSSSRHPNVCDWRFPAGSSGPFGEDTVGEWEELETVAYNWLHFRFGQRRRGTLNMTGWYDFHARKAHKPTTGSKPHDRHQSLSSGDPSIGDRVTRRGG